MTAHSAEKPLISYKSPGGEDERPVITEIIVTPQGTDFAIKLQFDKAPWGEDCRNRCANATLFFDTDNSKATGLKLTEATAAETGADLAVLIQGTKVLVDDSKTAATLRVKVVQLSDEATSVDQGTVLNELDLHQDSERVLSEGTSVFLLVEASGELPMGSKARIIYHPPDAKALTGLARGLAGGGGGRVELYKRGKLVPPPKKKAEKH